MAEYSKQEVMKELARRELIKRGKLNEGESGADKNSRGNVSQLNDFLPGRNRVDELISQREDPLEVLKKEAMTPYDFINHPIKSALKPIVTTAKLAAVPLGRGESAIASVGKALQEGRPKDIIDELISGISGKKQVQLGDLVRSTGFGGSANEALASMTGFFGMVGATNLVTRGKLLEGANKVKNSFQQSRALAKSKKDFYLKNKAEMLQNGVGDVRRAIGHEIDEVYKKIGDNALNPDDAGYAEEILSRVPSSTIKRFNRSVGTKFGEEGGKIKSVKEIQTLKQVVRRSIPDRIWKGLDSPTSEQQAMMDDYFELNDIVANHAGDFKNGLLELNKKYKKISDFRSLVSKITKDQSTGLTNPMGLKNIRSISSQGKLEALQKYSKEFFPQAESIIKDIDKFNRNEKIIRAVRNVTGTLAVGAAGGAAYNALRNNQ